MEITEHQASILKAIVDGKTIQYRNKCTAPEGSFFAIAELTHAVSFLLSPSHEVRIKPDVIIVNGIEVPAPEKQELPENARYWVANATDDYGCSGGYSWGGGDTDKRWLRYELVHLSRDAAGAHGRAMRAHKPG